MKLIYRILFFLLAIFYINISEANILVFDAVISETNIISNVAKNKNKSVEVLGNDFGISCKSGSKLVDYRNLALGSNTTAAKGVTAPKGWITQTSKKGGGTPPSFVSSQTISRERVDKT